MPVMQLTAKSASSAPRGAQEAMEREQIVVLAQLSVGRALPKAVEPVSESSLPSLLSHVNFHHMGGALFSSVLSQALNKWHHAPHVGCPFQSSN